MSKFFSRCLLAGLCALVLPISLNAQQYKNGLVDKVIAVIGNEMIQLSTLEQEVQLQMTQGVITDKNLRCNLLEELMVSKLFLAQARIDSLPVNEDNVSADLDRQLQQIKTRLGGEKATEDYFHKPIFKLREELLESHREESLTQAMQAKIVQGVRELTPADIEKFYKRTPKDSLPIVSTQYQLRQIVIYPNKEEAIMQVREKLLEFRERVLNGEKFSTLATLYSQDPYSARRGGELGMAAKSMYWPAFGDAAFVLKDGQVSQIVETPDGFHIIQMISKEGDMFNCRHILLKPEVTTAERGRCLNRLDSISNLILKDSLDFEIAARRFSEDLKSRLNGGLMVDENSGSPYYDKDQLKASDYTVLRNLKEGQISEAFQSADNEGREGNMLFKIIKLVKIIPSHPANLKDDYSIIQNIAKNNQSQDALEEFTKEKQQTTYIKIDPLFKDCSFQREGWFK